MRRVLALVPWVMCAFAVVSVDLHVMDTTVRGVELPAASASDRADAKGKTKKPHRAKAVSVNRCVSYTQQQLESGMHLELDNKCEQPLSCTMKWSVTCQHEDGTSEAHPQTETFALVPSEAYTVDASAAVCGEDAWQVAQVRWSCRSDAQ